MTGSLLKKRPFPIFRQLDAMDCGPTCLRMIAKYHGKHLSLESLRERSSLGRQGVSLLGMSYAAEQLGFRTLSTKATFEQLSEDAPLPCIAHWNQEHFVVVYRITKKKVYVADPDHGRVVHDIASFQKQWASIFQGDQTLGILLFLDPTASFFELPEEQQTTGRWARYLMVYVRQYRRFFAQVVLGMLVASLLQLIFPFLTQAIVDHGINSRDISFVYVVLIAQLALFFSRTVVEFIRNRILFHVGTRIYVSIISDFLLKLLQLPLAFFDNRMVGDILQRVQDNHRVQHFLTAATLNVIFSAFTFMAFSVVLAIYSSLLFFVFMTGSVLYAGYILLFLRWRKTLDQQRFQEEAKHQSILFEMIQGMQEIKLNNAEQQKRWAWERVQARLFRVNLRSLTLEQFQDGGAIFINELKNITVTFLAAKLVIDGHLTLGMLLAVQYIIGQLNSPLSLLIWFAQSTQDAKISLERLSEVHDRENEEDSQDKIHALPTSHGLRFRGVSFGYDGPMSPQVLTDLDLEIPEGKVTAIVGISGSGKTTLLKLLLKFYEPDQGEILVGQTRLRNLSNRLWRGSCGVVMQDGHIFSDTIGRNIAVGEERMDSERLLRSAEIANIQEFVESLPMAYNTKIGSEGIGMSTGQKQRILIARAIYSDPDFLFFDEATSALDANNEREIMESLEAFYLGRTVVVIAHRLSTVKNADQIVVLDKGRIAERGNHEELTALRGHYYGLVKNQLELGR